MCRRRVKGLANAQRLSHPLRYRGGVIYPLGARFNDAMTTPRVSVVLATFNGAEFLGEQLDSLFKQSLPPCELIISDDGSSDDTVAIAEKARRDAPFPVRVVRNPGRLGYGENFLAAASLATGDFIAFCDQDDVWDPKKLEAAATSLQSTGAHLHVHAARLVDRRGAPLGTFDQGIERAAVVGPRTLAPWGVFYGFSMTFRRELLALIPHDQRGGHTFEFTGALSHDLWIYCLAWSLGSTVLDPAPLASYRRHGNNETPEVRGALLQRLSVSLGTAARPELRRDDIARHRAAILLEMAARLSQSSAYASEARLSAACWSRIAAHEAARIRLYEKEGLLRRAASFVRLTATGAYAKASKGGLGRRLLIKDALFGVLQAARLKAKLRRG